MFTGLILDVGTVRSVETTEAGAELCIATALAPTLTLGASIATDGVCLTVTQLEPDAYWAQASPETLRRTTLGGYAPGRPVNLETPLSLQTPLGGHFVTGHVDCVATIAAVRPEGNSVLYGFALPEERWAALCVEKGSIAVNGISLTVNAVEGATVWVAIIPHTLAHTNLGPLAVGDAVNVETDMLGKYVQRLLQGHLPAPSLG